MKNKLIVLFSVLFLFTLTAKAEEAETAEDVGESHLLGSWGGLQNTFTDNGLTVDFVVTNDVASNFDGGVKNQTVNLTAFDFTVGLDTEKAGLWSDGQVFAYFLALPENLHQL